MYMKKMLSLILALMLLMLCPAMAETVVETVEQPQTLVSPDGSYSITVPADYFPMNAEVMVSLFATEEMQRMLAQAMGLEDASQLAMYFETLEASNMMIVYSGDLVGNLNVQAVAATMTMDQLVMLKALMDEAMIQQYVSMGLAQEDIQLMEIQEIAGRRWYGLKLAMAGEIMQTMITVENGVQYVITFTGLEEQDAQSILESFTVTAAAE